MSAFIEQLASKAGIVINGNRPWDIQVHNKKFYGRVLNQGSLGLGESYMDGWWDAKKLDEFFNKVLRSGLEKQVRINPVMAWTYLKAKFTNLPRWRPFQIGESHYDIGNDLYEAMLDKHLTYSCGYWKDAKTLDEAQEEKLDLVCRKIGLKSGDRVLDIGSGWGSFINFAAEHYGAEAVGLTVSKEQAEYFKFRRDGLPTETHLQDYRYITGQFNQIVSLGMFEHVGYKNYRAFMKKVHSLLSDDGLFLLHTIGRNTSVFATDPWVGKYIFPYGMLPSIAQIGKAIEGLFVMEDWHNFSADYDTTLMHWHRNFNEHWKSLSNKYGDRFYRMWTYYLLAFAGSFRARKNQLWQIVLSKKGRVGGYTSVR